LWRIVEDGYMVVMTSRERLVHPSRPLPSGALSGRTGTRAPKHVTVLSGTLLVGRGDVWDPTKLKETRAGEVVEVPAGVVHFSAVREETVMEVKITGPYEIEYVLESDDPSGSKASTMPAAGRQHPFSR
jgi:hypothetical protein